MADADECAPPAPASSRISLYDSALTLPSDSENYSAPHEHDADHALSASHSSSSSPVIVYRPQQTLWRVLRGAAINLVLPFVNGLMLGLGELLAHEAAFRLGWTNTKVSLLRWTLGVTGLLYWLLFFFFFLQFADDSCVAFV